MGTTPNLSLPYPELSDSPDVPRDIKALAEAIEGTGLYRVVYGFVNAGTIGGVEAGSAYVWNVPQPNPPMNTVVYASATWRYMSTPAIGYHGPTSTVTPRLSVHATVNVEPNPSTVIQVTAYFPVAYTVDARGREGIFWVIAGT
jgi:hypothetical protein